MPELKLRRIFPAGYFPNTNLPEEKVQVLPSEKKLSELLDYSPNIFKKSNFDRYVERPSATFCNGKYSASNDFCYAEFLSYYTLENKSSNSCEYQTDESDDSLIEKNHEESSYPKLIKLMISGERMRCRKVRRILRYHVRNKIIISREICLSCTIYSIHSETKKSCYHHCIKINCNSKEPRILQTLTKSNLNDMVI